MNWDINVWQGLVAGLAAMVPGAVIYHPKVLGTAWAKSIGIKMGDMGSTAAASMVKMLVTSLLNGVAASLVVRTIGATSVGEAVLVGLVLSWFWVSASMSLVFFEGRSWKWFQITALNYIVTGALIGLVLGLFL